MKMPAIQSHIETFIQHLRSSDKYNRVFIYDIISNLSGWFSPGSEGNAKRLELAMESEVSRRLWKGVSYDPKEMMLEFFKMEEDYCIQMFRDLFDESRDVVARIDRFQFYSDELLEIYKKNNPNSNVNNHDQDASIISLYLAGEYPDKYCYYPGMQIFNQALRAVESPNLCVVDDLGRYFKVSRALDTILRKNEELIKYHSLRFMKNPGQADYRQLAHDFIVFMAGK